MSVVMTTVAQQGVTWYSAVYGENYVTRDAAYDAPAGIVFFSQFFSLSV